MQRTSSPENAGKDKRLLFRQLSIQLQPTSSAVKVLDAELILSWGIWDGPLLTPYWWKMIISEFMILKVNQPPWERQAFGTGISETLAKKALSSSATAFTLRRISVLSVIAVVN
jgi:hypothetical protein